MNQNHKSHAMLSGVMLSVICLISFTACPTEPPAGVEQPQKTLAREITTIGWSYINMAHEFQTLVWKDFGEGTCFLSFDIVYKGDPLEPGDIKSVTANYDDIIFSIPVDKDILFDLTSDPTLHGIDSFYWWNVDNGTDDFPLGPWTFDITYKDDSISTYKKTFHKPGTTETEDHALICTENYSTSGSNIYKMLKRADITKAELNTTTQELQVQFSINDSQPRTGKILIYNDENYIGSSNLFIDDSNIVSSDFVDNQFHTDGSINDFIISLTDDPDIIIDSNKTNYAVILLYDGKQFELEDPGNYDCRSYSTPLQLTVVN